MNRPALDAGQAVGADVGSARVPEPPGVDEEHRPGPELRRHCRLVIEEVLASHAATADLPLTVRMCLARDLQRAFERSGVLLAAREDGTGAP